MDKAIPLARRLIAAGTLPMHDKVKTFGGRSTGSTCRLCGEPIRAGQAEIELEDSATRTATILHPECYAAWLAASQGREVRQA
jgi:hypothetical protein